VCFLEEELHFEEIIFEEKGGRELTNLISDLTFAFHERQPVRRWNVSPFFKLH
jgi:hypothetical protein